MANKTTGHPPPNVSASGEKAHIHKAQGTRPASQNTIGKVVEKTAPWYAQVWSGVKKGGLGSLEDDLGEDRSEETIPKGKWETLGVAMQGALEMAADDVRYGGRGPIIGMNGRASMAPAPNSPTRGRTPSQRTLPPNHTNPEKPPTGGGGGGGAYVLAQGGPCIVGKYSEIKGKCGKGGQAHHIIPDSLNRTGNRAQGAKGMLRNPGMPSLADGPSICLQGHKGTTGSEHNTAHQCDSEICAKGKLSTVPGTIAVKDAVPIAMRSAIVARPDCKAQIEAAVRKAYPNYETDNRPMNSTGRPAKGDAKAHVESGGQTHPSKQPKRRR